MPSTPRFRLIVEGAPSTKFERLELRDTPKEIADDVSSFIEGINSFVMLDRNAIDNSSNLPMRSKLYTGPNSLVAYQKAARAYQFDSLKSILRKPFKRNKEGINEIIFAGTRYAEDSALSYSLLRAADFETVRQWTYSVVNEELARKMPLAPTLTKGIVDSTLFLAGMKAVADLDFENKDRFMKHAIERWNIVTNGFGICLYQDTTPYLFCPVKGGSILPDNNIGIFGSICHP